MTKKYIIYPERNNYSMRQYEEYINQLVQQQKDEVFYNSGPDHAAAVMSAIFNSGNRYIKIYAGELDKRVSKQRHYENSLESFLRKDGVTLKIILQRYNKEEEPEIFDLLRYYNLLDPAKIEIKTHNFRVARGLETGEVHFTVADDRMYRVEDDVINFTAEGNFNDAKRSLELSHLFDQMFCSPKIVAVSL